ncbi:hypothetical protein K6Q96_06370 [Grimontia kaedaensis]|uniref:Lipoprotein n=1 Tax=Grimontia kaedaensis TaxID=2872157 RepID=A0ABY4WX94_9GAMM|nr:hypothetical protein [Grimontia kaedaensis]USH03619.1 hypothetical protein K6Q96_06370 [Grimontia kaedaensis]
MKITKLKGLAASASALALLAGCAIKQVEEVTVYKTKGTVQCESSGTSIFESELQLQNSGIEVLSSKCGVIEGVGFAQMCGGKTGDILVHTINARYENLAEAMGYKPVSALVSADAPQGFNAVECQ